MNNQIKKVALILAISIPIVLIACSRINMSKLSSNVIESNNQETDEGIITNDNKAVDENKDINSIDENNKETIEENSPSESINYEVSTEPSITNKNLLIIGIDARKNEPARADAIILINMRNDKVNFISIPRDTLIKLDKRGNQKINASYAYGGIDLCIDSVEKLLDTKIDNYLVFNFKAIQKGVDALGGFTVTIPKTIKIKDPELKKCFTLRQGSIKLNGIQTLEYLRYRSDGRGDIGRIYRQQEFIKDLQQSFLKLENVPLIPKAYLAVKDEIKTDLSASNMASYFISAYRLRNNFEYYTLEGYSKMIDKISYYVLYKDSLNKIRGVLK
ncbi:LCP family protein [Lutispora thermophila]|uniref:Transcriptional attenuator, LytR family n=1 Tax=Lutispora thermophila DSM 19022 TaxID=1122184 RepID=A0A1M6FH82_9FIRM|nr:LCP family protein [Lutispora thermophila]SHI97060.1 transcriptional attenuator, LytR family [Lutispora thermophila DSM 19022]